MDKKENIEAIKRIDIDKVSLTRLIVYRTDLRMPVLTLQAMFNRFSKESLCRFFEFSKEEVDTLETTIDKMLKKLRAGGKK